MLEAEKQIQALRDSTPTTTQAIENQTRTIQHSCDILNKNLQKSIQDGIKGFEEYTNRYHQLLTKLVNSNQVDSSIVKIVSNLLNDKNKSQFSLKPVEGSSILFTINPTKPQQVVINGSTMTFQNGNTYDFHDPDLSYFITNSKLEEEIQNKNLIFSVLNDFNQNIN